MSPPDPISLILDLLKADAGVAALTSLVYGGGVPAGVQMPQAAVVVKPAGGPGRKGFEGWRRGRIDTVCYGATLLASWELHLAVREALENMLRSGALFSVEVSSDGANALDPTELWPVCYASYVVLSAVAA